MRVEPSCSADNRVNYQVHLGAQVRLIRRSRQMSQATLADEAGLTRPYISNIERGRVNPSLDAVLRIQVALRLSSIEQLLSGLPRWGSDDLASRLSSGM